MNRVWTNGSRPVRSLRVRPGEKAPTPAQGRPAPAPDAAIAAALGLGPDTSSHIRGPKRAEADERRSQRDPHRQMGSNPFFAGSDYAADLEVRDAFLLPKDSNSIQGKDA